MVSAIHIVLGISVFRKKMEGAGINSELSPDT